MVQHTMKDVIGLLDSKIKELQDKRNRALAKPSEKNAAAVDKMNQDLAKQEDAKRILMSSCCFTQSCDYDADI